MFRSFSWGEEHLKGLEAIDLNDNIFEMNCLAQVSFTLTFH